ncbi:MAG: hypothetical protein HQK96_20875, partial [Nitrospirae bacterium]|nr:hypothetical protein [Nitrospirota bacterium]
GDQTAIIANDKSYDIIQINQDMTYKTVSLGLIMGLANIEVAHIKNNINMVLVEGRIIFTPSRIFREVYNVLPPETAKSFGNHAVLWEITNKNDRYIVVERITQ